MDINKFRDSQVAMHGLSKIDAIYTFYHDETNNIRKLHIGTDGLNVAALKVFVLGGIVHEGPPRPLDIQSLRSAMRIQPNAPEIKLEHVAKGDFLVALRSTKLTTFLDWIMTNSLLIHYHDLDPFFWSIADIIDSIAPFTGDGRLFPYIPLLKSDLALILKADVPETVDLFRRYSYPDVPRSGQTSFLNELVATIDRNADLLAPINGRMLKHVILAGRDLDSLAFIEGDEANRLIDDFSIFYAGRIALFKNAHHILDMEEAIRTRFLQTPLSDAGKPMTNFRFADSKAEPGVQISDVVTGLIGKLKTYLTDTPMDQVEADRVSLEGTSLGNVERLTALISASHTSNIAFLHHVGSLHDLDKLGRFLRF